MRHIPYTLLVLAATAGFASAQATAYTTPVGYVNLGDTAPAADAVKAASDLIFSVPLDRSTAFAGTITSITGGNEINISGTPNFAANVWTTTPHLVRISSGGANGFVALIDSHDTDSLTVTLPAGQNLTSVLAGDKVKIQPAWTANSFFDESSFSDGEVELYLFDETAGGINPSPAFLYVWDGTDWLDQGSGSPADPVLYPGQLMVLRNAAATGIADIVISGEVPASNLNSVLVNNAPGQQDLPFGLQSPVDQTLADTGLAALAQPDDELYFYDNVASGINKSPSTLLVFDGTDWLDQGSGSPVDPNTFMVKAGEGFIYRRASSSPTVTWSFEPSYLPLP